MGRKLTIAGLILMTAGLTACGANNDALNDTRNNGNNGNTRPIGYYTNENDADRQGDGMDHDGPVSELMEDQNDQNGRDRNTTNVNDRVTADDRVPLTTDGTYNNTNNRNMNRNGTNNNGYNNQENRRLAAKIANRVKQVKNVYDTQVMVTDEKVVIAVRSHDDFTQSDRQNVKKAARNYADGRDVQVSTDKGLFTRLHKMNRR
ncbi:YhcN/YlaJ family sporulation lipoprotein [Bacillus mojavensis]|uniref:YhcN/YlaJ family sporulation lipoprotein n=1 Tax=Bacillus mojavensis TaxID=72360 RepID=UPI002DB65694|nr:YhcN/YlaJ family sporulation lipoprotein [Bacillus mojavensis]MEC1620171.1 YhcN/YlaJ family sporulation lipoprotein [Bacillus mojavensis]MEC1658649.1 YhcN/YlaJ family sporulation lipoprotein [Bacillus mojavensis]MEC1684440.1 YhcN/YlaJ family sporulation lipoprotein [Bacillus mojavensis]MEC1709716.1 YhcN/YlaJ family sporulation lipoprotein [Bacillus mojavensis]